MPTSQIFTIKKITKFSFADTTSAASVAPTPLTDILEADLKKASANFNFPADTVTADYLENNEPYNARVEPQMKTVSIGLAQPSLELLQHFMPVTYAAAVATTSGETINFDGTDVKNKYIDFTGVGMDDKVIHYTLYNAVITTAYSGAIGRSQEAQAVVLTFNLLYSKGFAKTLSVVGETPAA